MARQLKQSWDKFKQKLFADLKDSERQLGSALNAFYQKVYEQKSEAIDRKSQELKSGKNFLNLNQKDKRAVLWAFFPNRLDPSYDEAFRALANTDRDNLIKGLAYHIGTEEIRNLKPCLGVETEVDNHFRERIKEFKPPAGIEFLNSGSSGTAFFVKSTAPYVLKVSNQRDTSGAKPAYRIGFEKAGINQAEGIDKREWLQKLAKAEDQYLGLDEEDGVLATEYLPGITLDSPVSPEQLQDYVSQDFLTDFIQTIFKLASNGADLSSLAYPNLIYDSEKSRLALMDFTGLDNEHYNSLRDFIKKNPLGFTIYKMISDVVLLQSTAANKLREKIGTALGGIGSNLKLFMDQRFKLLCASLDQIFNLDIPGFSKKLVIQELDELQKTNGNNLFGAQLGLTDDGLKYIESLKVELGETTT